MLLAGVAEPVPKTAGFVIPEWRVAALASQIGQDMRDPGTVLQAGERVMALLQRLYAKLGLKITEAKTVRVV